MNAKPLVSILMPAFNSESYINEAIDSILDQTYDNIQLIIYDDGSTDATRTLIKDYLDPRIIGIFADQNYGVVHARNVMIDRAEGKYIALMDADDIAHPSRIEKQLVYLENNFCDVIGSAQLVLNQKTGEVKKSKDNFTDSDIRALLSVYCTLCNSSVTMRSEILKKFKYDANFLFAEDYFLWARLAGAQYRFKNLKDRLITYRIYPQQSSLLSKERSNMASMSVRRQYLEMLGISAKFTPQPMAIYSRLRLGVGLIGLLNQQFSGISFRANCEIYARFQSRNNAILSIMQRLERVIIGVICLVSARLLRFKDRYHLR
ncbi:glycosyltransferase family 2 protein [Polynucleobacter sp. Adler-ghost]|uniref:glycosyltransferase family 2 protein n=1 Tax=Polynucleobacter sp. Adler-ghost TaxID=2770234 RepID=UPI001BFDACCA|nr:glycosyltransferase family 2 protein [Polynucleobacter sp. Adler-ghost]QWE30979.1 glycosyltransferase family 2 protein [Polynucleobacter sp. Adler-ghost]